MSKFKSPPKFFYDGAIVENALKVVAVEAQRAAGRALEQQDEDAAGRAQELKGAADQALSLLEETDLNLSGGDLGKDSTFGSLIIYASRYAMGRKSYAVGEVTGWLHQHWGLLAPSVQKQIQEDIERRLTDESHARAVHDNPERKPPSPLGQDIDREQWLEILDLPTDANSSQ